MIRWWRTLQCWSARAVCNFMCGRKPIHYCLLCLNSWAIRWFTWLSSCRNRCSLWRGLCIGKDWQGLKLLMRKKIRLSSIWGGIWVLRGSIYLILRRGFGRLKIRTPNSTPRWSPMPKTKLIILSNHLPKATIPTDPPPLIKTHHPGRKF